MTLTNSSSPSLAVAKYGALPRASTSGTRSDRSGKPALSRAPTTSSPVGRGLGALKTRRIALPIAHPTASSKNAVAGSTDEERTRAMTTRARAPHHTFRHRGPVAHTSTVTMAMAVPTEPWSFHAHLPRTLWRATWENDAGSRWCKTDVA